jgi:4-carboxymuconolactone decarboxylase
MIELDDKMQRGAEVIGSMMGAEFAQKLSESATSGKFGSDISRMALSFAFADAWGREGLDRKSKSLAICSALIALRQEKELKNHVKIGAANGLSVNDFESLLIQLTPYVGFPCIATAQTAVIEGLREIGKDPGTRTSEERGLL